MFATIDPRQWPGRVIPETDVEIATAVESLCLRAQWADADRGAVAAVVRRWFDRGWCVDAVLRAVELTPDGKLQKRKSDKQEPHIFLKDRLRFWFADDGDSATDPLKPPLSGMPFAQWWAINRRNERINQQRRRKPLSAEGEKAREAARVHARGSGRDAIAMARAKGQRQQDALDALVLPGMTPPTFEESRRLRRRRSASRQVCNWVGRQQVIANDPTVRKALKAVLAAAGTPTLQAVKRLHNAVRAARWTAEMAAIEALTNPATDALTPIGKEARRILRYVDQAIEENLPFDVMVFLLRNNRPLNRHRSHAS